MARRGRRWAGRPEPGRQFNDAGRCVEHDKVCFRTKQAARAKTNEYNHHHTSVHRCTETNLWHVGGIPRSVIRGIITRSEVYNDSKEEAA